jgi:hypothetical protein
MKKDLYPDDPVKREDVYNAYKKYLGNVSHLVRLEVLTASGMRHHTACLKFTDIFEECTASWPESMPGMEKVVQIWSGERALSEPVGARRRE